MAKILAGTLPKIGGAWVRNRSAEVFPEDRNRVWRAVREVRNPFAVIRLLQMSIYETDPM